MIFSLVASSALLWLLLNIFTRGSVSSTNETESWCVILAMQGIHLILGWTVAPWLGLLIYFVEFGVLYLLITKICDLNRKTTLRICIYYVVILFSIQLFISLLMTPVSVP